MKNRKILLPTLLSIALAFSLFLPASVLHTAPVMAQGHVMPMAAAGLETQPAKWKPVLSVPPSDIENVTWVLESYRESGNLWVLPCSAINAKFEGGRIFGYAGCNCYGGDYELKGNNLSITRLLSTEAWCGEHINKLAQEYLTALRDAESYEIEGGKLRINCGNRLLVFNKGYNSMKWWLLIIVITQAVVAGLVIFFVRRTRHA